MKFTRDEIRNAGFGGFTSFRDLRNGRIATVPAEGGVYVVLREERSMPSFLENNPGGRFKGRNPTVDKQRLLSEWVSGTHVVYIGKGDVLRRRMKQFMEFGEAKPIGIGAGDWCGRLRTQSIFLLRGNVVEIRGEKKSRCSRSSSRNTAAAHLPI